MSARCRRLVAFALCAVLYALPAGCNIIGAFASKMPKPDIDAAYKGLAGQTVGIMVWADKTSLLIDWPTLQRDMGNSIAFKIKAAQDTKAEELVGTTFPYQPDSFIRYQREHPEVEVLPIVEVAPKLAVSRLIYVEINSFSTRPPGGSVALFLGQTDISLKVIEVADGKAKIAYHEDHIQVQFPKSAPKEGAINQNEATIYRGVLDSISSEVALRFVRHPDTSN